MTEGRAGPNLDGEIRDGRHVLPIRVYYEDTDFTGVVYHASYLRFMERGRTNYLRLLGVDQRALFEETEQEAPGFAFVVRSMQIEFLKPARMDDVLEIVTEPDDVKGASSSLRQCVMRGGRAPGRGAGARRLRLGRASAADPQAAAHRHAGGPRSAPQLMPVSATPGRRAAASHVKTLHMSWSKDGKAGRAATTTAISRRRWCAPRLT